MRVFLFVTKDAEKTFAPYRKHFDGDGTGNFATIKVSIPKKPIEGDAAGRKMFTNSRDITMTSGIRRVVFDRRMLSPDADLSEFIIVYQKLVKPINSSARARWVMDRAIACSRDLALSLSNVNDYLMLPNTAESVSPQRQLNF